MSCCLSVYFLVVFKTVLRDAVDVWFRRAQIVFWAPFVEFGDLLTPSVIGSLFTRLTS